MIRVANVIKTARTPHISLKVKDQNDGNLLNEQKWNQRAKVNSHVALQPDYAPSDDTGWQCHFILKHTILHHRCDINGRKLTADLVVLLPADCQHRLAAAGRFTDHSHVAEPQSFLRNRLKRNHRLGIVHCHNPYKHQLSFKLLQQVCFSN